MPASTWCRRRWSYATAARSIASSAIGGPATSSGCCPTSWPDCRSKHARPALGERDRQGHQRGGTTLPPAVEGGAGQANSSRDASVACTPRGDQRQRSGPLGSPEASFTRVVAAVPRPCARRVHEGGAGPSGALTGQALGLNRPLLRDQERLDLAPVRAAATPSLKP